MKATVNEVRNEPLERTELVNALQPLLDLVGVEAKDLAELHVTGGVVRVRVRPRTSRGKAVPSAIVTVRHRVVEDE